MNKNKYKIALITITFLTALTFNLGYSYKNTSCVTRKIHAQTSVGTKIKIVESIVSIIDTVSGWFGGGDDTNNYTLSNPGCLLASYTGPCTLPDGTKLEKGAVYNKYGTKIECKQGGTKDCTPRDCQ